MVSRRAARDSLAIIGCTIGLASLFLGWLTLKPNRLAAGTSLSLWQSLGWDGATVVVAFWLVCIVLSFGARARRVAIFLGLTANLIVVVALGLAGFSASRLLGGETPVARVSLSAGVWLTLAGAYTVVFAARQQFGHQPVWRSLVSWTGLVACGVLLLSGRLNDLSILQELIGGQERFVAELGRHVLLFAGSVAIGALLGIPLGVWATRARHAARPIFYITNIVQTIPSLALFGFLIAPLSALSFAFPVLREFGIRGIGTAPAIIALIIYSLLPIVRNTFVGLNQLDPAVIDAGFGMGMSRFQVFRRLEAPLAAPLVLEGIRIASVQAVGNTAIAALIGAGGLGFFIFQGFGQAAPDLIVLGAIAIIALALLVDRLMRTIVIVATPKGLMGESR